MKVKLISLKELQKRNYNTETPEVRDRVVAVTLTKTGAIDEEIVFEEHDFIYCGRTFEVLAEDDMYYCLALPDVAVDDSFIPKAVIKDIRW